jgi:alanyl-tRNA synthetase
MKAGELRRRYLEFFGNRDHRVLPGAPLVPNDPTLLFTSAGMVQFKDVFWGRTTPSIPHAVTCQKCFRTTDIENVGKTAFHNTFFEMLGNFSFGDYFKEGAIRLAWEFLIDELGLPVDRLSVSIHRDDDEAFALWHNAVGLTEDRITRLGKEHNWWGPVGNTGPCGPDSEIFYDTGAGNACGPDCEGVACECNRYSEIWNLVFIEYDAKEDGSFEPLARKNIDTGMGLERTSAVLQGVDSVFESDLFRPIIDAVEAACSRPLQEADHAHRNVIADHVRAVLFLLADGVMPGNERQGYVLRRILRRAVRAGEKIDLPSGSLAQIIEPVIEVLGGVYPEIVEARDLAHRLIGREEETFRRTLRDGERRLVKVLEELREAGQTLLPGELAFELTDTYGFPLEMTQEIAAESGITVDRTGFEHALEAQRARSRVQIDVHTAVGATGDVIPAGEEPTRFVGYEALEAEAPVENVLGSDGVIGRLVFLESPFYAESGGQVGDTGSIENLSQTARARVTGVGKNAKGVFLHRVEVTEGTFVAGDRCRLTVDADRRQRIRRNHTATHLLHAALRDILGSHVKQAGSEVSDAELRFDFSHFEKMLPDEIARAEDLANAAVLADHEVKVSEVSLEEAQRLGAIGLFEDEYRGKDVVRVVRVGDVSMELCGGTHVSRSGEIGLIKVISEEAIASGVRRIRAITGDAVLTRLREQDALLLRLHAEIGEDPIEGIHRLRDELLGAREQLDSFAAAQVRDIAAELIETAEEVGNVRLIGGQVDLSGDRLKDLADVLEERARPAAVLLVGSAGGAGLAVCKRSKGLDAIDAGALIRTVSGVLGGGGGGGKAFAQGGGPRVDKLDEALAAGRKAIHEALS